MMNEQELKDFFDQEEEKMNIGGPEFYAAHKEIMRQIKNAENGKKNYKRPEVPIWEKANLTLEEAAVYSGIGINRIRELTNQDSCPFVLWVGTKRLIKRRKFDEFTENSYSL